MWVGLLGLTTPNKMAGEMTATTVVSEDIPGDKWDRCIADTIIKTGVGVGLGGLFSLTVFRRRIWPVVLGLGFGLGFAVSNCQHDFKRVDSLYLKPIKPAIKVKDSNDKN